MAKHRPSLPQEQAEAARRLGNDLRAARERLGWSLPDTAAFVRIRLRLLEALEDGRIADLPGPAYAVGFVRSYALALGVDAEALARRFRDEVGGAVPRVSLDFPRPVRQSHVPAGTVVMLGAVLTVGAYVGWYHVSDQRPIVVAVQQVPARLAPLALPVVPPPPARAVASLPAPIATASIPVNVQPNLAEASVPARGSAVAGAHVVLQATADSWVAVKDAQGEVLFSKLMHAGDSWPVPDPPPGEPAPTLTTGNAGGTVLQLDGVALPPMGATGAVRRDVSLDAASLRTADATPHP